MIVLGIESSCDDTSVALVQDGHTLLSIHTQSQFEVHKEFGGIVPELASRSHLQNFLPLLEKCMESASITKDQIDAIAVTYGPGLIGSLLVGLSYAKALAFLWNIPLIGVHHIQGHLMASFLRQDPPEFPLLGFVASGGHTHVYLMKSFDEIEAVSWSIDDAAGEAFDKGAKLLGLGFPGGPVIDRRSKHANPDFVKFPRPMPTSPHFSFSGLKTSLLTWIQKHGLPSDEATLNDVAASYQEAIVDCLVNKLIKALEAHSEVKSVVLCGGVAANSRLREKLSKAMHRFDVQTYLTDLKLCTDNAAMIACAGYHKLASGQADSLELNASASVPLTSSL
ncbi:MAG: tRNA (adenosine(37)-N6)-threonylcarbamoyltransferase complex transferase subunit TsaD [Bdellovibrionota bacterium]